MLGSFMLKYSPRIRLSRNCCKGAPKMQSYQDRRRLNSGQNVHRMNYPPSLNLLAGGLIFASSSRVRAVRQTLQYTDFRPEVSEIQVWYLDAYVRERERNSYLRRSGRSSRSMVAALILSSFALVCASQRNSLCRSRTLISSASGRLQPLAADVVHHFPDLDQRHLY